MNESTELCEEPPTSLSSGGIRRGTAADCIAAGMRWLAKSHLNTNWVDLTMTGPAGEVWVTAYVLARLGEFPQELLRGAIAAQVERSLGWLERVRIPGSGWNGLTGQPDAFTTSWAIMALRSHGRSVARSALDLVLSCRQANGGFAASPPQASVDVRFNLSSLEVSITALRALSMCDSASIDFLAARLSGDMPGSHSGRLARLYVCSEILDWEKGFLPRALLHRAAQCTVQSDSDKAYDQALLLRCLLGLRNHRAWTAADVLRRLQRPDGSWSGCAVVAPSALPSTALNSAGFAETGVISTVTALSALMMSESQPGLYFGSDLPRRFRES